jgi:hypothetical protein
LRFPHRVGGLEGIVVPPPALGRLDVSEKPVRRKQAAEAIKARVNSSTQGRTADRTRVSVTSASRHIMSDELRSGYRRAPCMYAQQLCTVWIGFMAERERERERRAAGRTDSCRAASAPRSLQKRNRATNPDVKSLDLLIHYI